MKNRTLLATLATLLVAVSLSACAAPVEDEDAASQTGAYQSINGALNEKANGALGLSGFFKPVTDDPELAGFVAAPINLAREGVDDAFVKSITLPAAPKGVSLRAARAAVVSGSAGWPAELEAMPLLAGEEDTLSKHYTKVELVRHMDVFLYRLHPKGGGAAVRTPAFSILKMPTLYDHDFRTRVVQVAQAEYDARVAEGSKYQAAYVEYVKQKPESQLPWCNMFVSWLYDQAGRPINHTGQGFSYVPDMRKWLQESGQFTTDVKKVQPGDIIIFNWNDDGTEDHTGIVKSVTIENTIYKITTIEGNGEPVLTDADGKVVQGTYGLRRIVGFGHLF